MAWCNKCHYGAEDYNFDFCGRCGSRDMIDKNPFAEAFKNPHTLYNTQKGPKKGEKSSQSKKNNNLTIEDEVKIITKARS